MKITFGLTTPGSNFGIMMYNKNRLIKAHEKVGYQKQVCFIHKVSATK